MTYIVWAADDERRLFASGPPPVRCEQCGLVTNKAQQMLGRQVPEARVAYDLSITLEGARFASSHFVNLVNREQLTGLRFVPAGTGTWLVLVDEVVAFDAERRGTRFLRRCATCERYGDIVGATPALLKAGTTVGPRHFARTDIEFGSSDEKAPLLLCGDDAAHILRGSSLRGVQLEAVAE